LPPHYQVFIELRHYQEVSCEEIAMELGIPLSDVKSHLFRALKQTVMLIKSEVRLEVSAIDVGGWDTHFAQGASTGQMPNLMKDLAEGLAAFHADMFDHVQQLTTVTMSEFGRRASENGSLGTDHGHASMMMVLGGHVAGGRVHGEWPGMGEGQ
jgi:uncharacterized protein (DUF1501 family)